MMRFDKFLNYKFILSFIITASLMGCNNKKNEQQLKYLALGDSYTIGTSVEEAQRWPVLFAKELNLRGLNVDTPKIIAKNGWTTADLIEGIEKDSITESYDIVSLLIGVNNQYQGKSIEEYRSDLRILLEMSIKFAGNKKENVIVLSIPNWGKTPFAKDRDTAKITKEIKAFNTVKREECEKLGIKEVNITPLTLKVQENTDLLAKDSLHFSGKMHQLWVDEVINGLNKRKWKILEQKQ